MKKTIQRLKNERGLTLVELLAVIVILAIIAIIAFVFIGGVIDNSRKDAHISNAQQVINAAKLYETGGGTFPVEVEELQEGNYLEDILDPWTKKPYGKKASINKGNNGYTITGFSASGCDFGNGAVTESAINDGDRETLCKQEK